MVVLGDEVDHAGIGHVRLRTAQLLRRHALAGDALDHLRTGDEHLRLARLNDEIGQRRAVGRAARARSADQRDLRHRAGQHHVGVEDLAIAGERIDAFLHARAARIVDEDERRAGLQRLLHDLGDFDGVHFAGRTAGHREILARQVHQAAADGRRAGHHSVGRKALAGHAEQRGAMLGEQAGLLETARIHQRVHSFARRQLAALVLLFEPVRAAAQHRFAGALAELGDLLLHCMNGHMMKSFFEFPTAAGAHGHLGASCRSLDVVSDRRAHRALAVAVLRPREPLRARRRRRLRGRILAQILRTLVARGEELRRHLAGTWRRSAHLRRCRCSPAAPARRRAVHATPASADRPAGR